MDIIPNHTKRRLAAGELALGMGTAVLLLPVPDFPVPRWERE